MPEPRAGSARVGARAWGWERGRECMGDQGSLGRTGAVFLVRKVFKSRVSHHAAISHYFIT